MCEKVEATPVLKFVSVYWAYCTSHNELFDTLRLSTNVYVFFKFIDTVAMFSGMILPLKQIDSF